MADGLFQHDIVRDYALSRCVDLRGRHRRLVETLLAHRPAGGWPTVDSGCMCLLPKFIAR